MMSPSCTIYSLPSRRSLPDAARFGHAAQCHQVLIGDHFRPDEAFLQIGMDHAGAFHGAGATPNRPGADLILPYGEEGLQAHQVIREVDYRRDRPSSSMPYSPMNISASSGDS